MEFGEAARVARHDQVHAAQADVLGILGVLATEHQRWSRIDETTHGRIDALLEGIFADEDDSGRVCQHARRAAFDGAPRPLVLDAVRGILACWEGCYWRAASTEGAGERRQATCFDCGRGLEGSIGPDVFIAYGPILVVGALCQQCRGRTGSGSAPASERGG